MTNPKDITNNVYHLPPTNDPWDTFDEVLGNIRDVFALLGFVATCLFLYGWFTS